MQSDAEGKKDLTYEPEVIIFHLINEKERDKEMNNNVLGDVTFSLPLPVVILNNMKPIGKYENINRMTLNSLEEFERKL